MTDLISREALLANLRTCQQRCIELSRTYGDKDPNDEDDYERWANDYDDQIGLVKAQTAITPTVVANITGGVLQGASSDYPADLITLDFENDEDPNIELSDGSSAYRSGCFVKRDPDFVREVVEAEEPE